ncbi:MAG: DNA polymerase III subunit beta [Ectothiorhodospiraceae bacterium]|nr:DNA polymerase III subunit beta [Ectothiorhodospiraceae bacterium]MCH8504116.1 DNA polymerase III subunit beta [Ectothiorhodospiraceae bacterium]
MKIEIERETLLRPLQAVIGVVERRQTLPVLANVLMVADESGLSLTATDLEVELVARAEMDVQEAGQITVPARKLVDIVRNLPEGAKVRLSVEQDRAIVSAERSRFSLATLPASEFPSVEDIGETEPVLLPQGHLRELIEKTHFSMALQDVRYYLNGLLLELEPGRLRAVATDGHRLAMGELSGNVQVQNTQQVIVPRKGVQELLRLLDDTEDQVRLELSSNHIRVTLPELRFTSKLIDGRFPDYQRVIPNVEDNVVVAERETLRQALVRASILSNEKYRGVRFTLEPDTLKIQSNNPEQEQADEELSVTYPGTALEIGFNASYVLDALGAMDGEQVTIGLVDANSSCLIHDAGSRDFSYVVMPMRL